MPGDTSSSSRFFSVDVTEPFVMDAEGMMTVPTGPGLGVTPIPEILSELTTTREELAR
jgi:O-succinylbenzoate synthase